MFNQAAAVLDIEHRATFQLLAEHWSHAENKARMVLVKIGSLRVGVCGQCGEVFYEMDTAVTHEHWPVIWLSHDHTAVKHAMKTVMEPTVKQRP